VRFISEVAGCSGVFDLTIDKFEDDETQIPLPEAAFVIDGQHRLAGLRNLEAGRTFELNVSIFVGADKADRAEIFSTVNLAQTKVNRSLVFYLFTYAKTRSPYKFAHQIAVALNRDPSGPLHHKIKRLGVATPGIDEEETLSQATGVRGLLKNLPDDPDTEKNKGFLGRAHEPEPKEDWQRRVLVPFYREDNLAGAIAVMSNYFSAVEEKWKVAWGDVETGYVLNRTNGYNALARFFRPAYLSGAKAPGTIVTQEHFFELFDGMDLRNADFTVENYPPGSSGEGKLFADLIAQAGI
jgi:DGQHR domain-containing protein